MNPTTNSPANAESRNPSSSTSPNAATGQNGSNDVWRWSDLQNISPVTLPTFHQGESVGAERLSAEWNALGGGTIMWGQHAITAPPIDALRHGIGHAIYCRDLDSDRIWTAGVQPALAEPDDYCCSIINSAFQIERRDGDINLAVRFEIDDEHDLLTCYCELTNRGSTNRRLQLASYLEPVLQPASAHAGHPAFSKIFVETHWMAEQKAIRVRRRPRDPNSVYPQLLHCCSGFTNGDQQCDFETSRVAFVGRGRDYANPQALAGSVQNIEHAGKVGAVLDPIASLRCITNLAAGESTTISFATMVAKQDAQVEPLLTQARTKFTEVATAGWSIEPRNLSASHGGNENGAAAELTVGSSAHKNGVAKNGRSPLPGADSDVRTEGIESAEELQLENGLGGFSADGDEYVIRLNCDSHGVLQLPPVPWTNVIANERIGFIVSETGASCTWTGNSRLHRVTPWYNDPLLDPHADAVYVRDDASRHYWSAFPGPVCRAGPYEVRHGFGYSAFKHTQNQIEHEVTVFVPTNHACKVTRVRLTNRSEQTRNLSIFGFQLLALGESPLDALQRVDCRWEDSARAVVASNRGDCDAKRLVFSSMRSLHPASKNQTPRYQTDASLFVGTGTCGLKEPYAVTHDDELDSAAVPNNNDGVRIPAAAQQLTVSIEPNDSIELVMLLGEATDINQVSKWVSGDFAASEQIDQQLQKVREQWRQLARPFSIQTPSPAVNLLANGWLQYQNISCRLWGRSSFYQGGGAFGFRDQLQDATALIYHRPDWTRKQIVLHASHQFVEGDVMHWWHPPQRLGIRTKFSDDLVWLPLIAAQYVNSTGDDGLWTEMAPFLTDRQLEPGEDEALMTPQLSSESGSILEHCCRALDRSLKVGTNGLPLMGTGDWNDGMNRIGRLGVGESVWMGFFLYQALDVMIPHVEQAGESQRANRYRQHQRDLKAALNTNGWDGRWFLRAFHDDGQKIGSGRNSECRIDALVQAWSVLSGAGDEDKSLQAMSEVRSQLVDDDAGLIRLLTPPFQDADVDPGYIKGYLAGLRENGGQYTHGILWAIRAFAELGQGTEATRLFEMICPTNHTRTKDQIGTYQTEPYAMAADVYSVDPHAGRGGWTWYTGSAGWTFRVLWESILGITLQRGQNLRIDPRIPADWPGFEVEYEPPGCETTFRISVENESKSESGIKSATLDGEPLKVEDQAALIPLNLTKAKAAEVIIKM